MKALYWSRWPTRSVVLREATRRFTIMESTDAFLVADRRTGDLQRCATLVLAKAWAEARAGGRIVHHANGALEHRTRAVVGNRRRDWA